MIISIIAALDERRGIGWQGGIPWHLPADLARFKSLTMGHPLIAGRKTYQSIGGPLPGRTMIVLTRDPDFEAGDCVLASSLEEGLEYARKAGAREVFIIGGADVYHDALPLADFLHLSHVEGVFKVDVKFPEIDPFDWEIMEEVRFPADARNPLAHTYTVYRRKRD